MAVSDERPAANPFRMRAGTLICCLGLGMLALLLYEPWRALPFSILDFSEFLPILQTSSSLADATARLSEYYGQHGRSAVATYAWIALNWTLFGLNSAGWEWARFALMLSSVLLVFAFLRRLGATDAGATAGAALLVVAAPAAAAWTRLTGEPLSLLALVSAALLALDYNRSSRWTLRGIGILLLVLLAWAAKETSILAMPALLAVALWRDADGGMGRPRLTARTAWLGAGLALLATLLAIVTIGTVGDAGEAGYARSYGAGGITPGRFLAYMLTFTLPSTRFGAAAGVLAVGTLLVPVAVGWTLRIRRARRPSQQFALLAVLLSIPAAGAAVYLPWPRLEWFYAFPFLTGAAAIVALGVSSLLANAPRWRIPAAVMVAIFVAAAAVPSSEMARGAAGVREMSANVADRLGHLPQHDVLIVAVPMLAEQAWQGTGPTLRRYAMALGGDALELPPAFDVECARLPELRLAPGTRAVLLSFSHYCGRLPDPAATVVQTAQTIDPRTLRPNELTYIADFVLVTGVASGQQADPSSPADRDS